MHGRKCFALIALGISLAALSSCSSNDLMKPDCHSCTDEKQGWKEFSWNDLVGKWKGSVENLRNSKEAAKKTKTDKGAELNFVNAGDFLQAWGGTCKGLPGNAVVLNGVLWDSGSGAKEYDAFAPSEDDQIAYGRVSLSKLNGQGLCSFHRIGRVMGKNRLNLPTVAFSDSAFDDRASSGRKTASAGVAQEFNLEFLRFAPAEKATKSFTSDGRKPSSVKDQERPSLILRVFRVSTKASGGRGEWTGTEEFIYRLWKTN